MLTTCTKHKKKRESGIDRVRSSATNENETNSFRSRSSRFQRHYSGQLALFDRHCTRTTTTVTQNEKKHTQSLISSHRQTYRSGVLLSVRKEGQGVAQPDHVDVRPEDLVALGHDGEEDVGPHDGLVLEDLVPPLPGLDGTVPLLKKKRKEKIKKMHTRTL